MRCSLRHVRVLLALLTLLAPLAPARAAPRPAAPLTTVAVDLRDVADEPFRRLGLLALQRKLALRLAEAGFAVVAAERDPSVRLLLRPEEEHLRLEAIGPRGRVSRLVPRGEGDLEAYHLEVVHKAVEAARQVEAPAPASRPRAASRPASSPGPRLASRPRPLPPPPRPRERWLLDLGLGAMALLRVATADALFRGTGRLGRGPLALRGALAFAPSSSGDLQVYEWAVQLGASYRHRFSPALFLESGLLVGFLHHLYRLGGASPDSGSRPGFLATAPLELGWQVAGPLGVRLWVAPGLADSGRTHRIDGRVVWERSSFWLELGLSLALSLPL